MGVAYQQKLFPIEIFCLYGTKYWDRAQQEDTRPNAQISGEIQGTKTLREEAVHVAINDVHTPVDQVHQDYVGIKKYIKWTYICTVRTTV